ncbi:MAG: hypothetical protein ABIJ82_02920 [Patescibacteria group bacterium]|nr:hypothetical protein [Patescibacteria group bacterium]
MNSKPKLKFKWDMEYDQWTGKEFLTFKDKDIFSNSILKDHPTLISCEKMESGTRKEFIDEFVEKYYEEHKWKRLGFLKRAKEDWAKIETAFFETTDKLFSRNPKGGYNWPKGNYICYLSIFNCNPRFIKEKEFQAYYKHPLGINFVCIHEMLHFIFYDYLEKNFSKQYKEYDERVIWKLSEVFNDVILRTDEFISLTKQKEPSIYAESREELVKYRKMWGKAKGSTEIFIKNYFSSLKM